MKSVRQALCFPSFAWLGSVSQCSMLFNVKDRQLSKSIYWPPTKRGQERDRGRRRQKRRGTETNQGRYRQLAPKQTLHSQVNLHTYPSIYMYICMHICTKWCMPLYGPTTHRLLLISLRYVHMRIKMCMPQQVQLRKAADASVYVCLHICIQ